MMSAAELKMPGLFEGATPQSQRAPGRHFT